VEGQERRRRLIQSAVVKVLDILEHLVSQSAIGLSDLSRATRLSVSTAFRPLQT
jgi:DNA-binding IclR family transcriptional regulator